METRISRMGTDCLNAEGAESQRTAERRVKKNPDGIPYYSARLQPKGCTLGDNNRLLNQPCRGCGQGVLNRYTGETPVGFVTFVWCVPRWKLRFEPWDTPHYSAKETSQLTGCNLPQVYVTRMRVAKVFKAEMELLKRRES